MTSGSAPDGIGSEPSLLGACRLTRRVTGFLVIASVGAFVLFVELFAAVGRLVTGHSFGISSGTVTVSTPSEMLVGVVPLAAVLLAVTVAHEVLHGVGMARYGAKPRYGIGSAYLFPYAYAEGNGAVYTRNQALVVLLAPFVVISVGGVLALVIVPDELLVVALAANAAGSVADCWMAAAIARFPPTVRVADAPDGRAPGFGIYGRPGDDPGPTAVVGRTAAAFTVGILSVLAVLLVGSVTAVFHAAVTATGTVVVGDPGGFWFLFAHEFDPATGIARFEIGHRLVTLAAVLGGACAGIGSLIHGRFT